MFRRKKDSELDYTSLNEILKIGSKLSEIFYIIAIIAIIILGTHLVKEWGILNFIGELVAVISPIFIGLIIAWLFDPLVRWFQKKKIPRLLGCLIVYLLIIGSLFLLLYLIVPTFIEQIKDFIGTVPTLIKDVTKVVDAFFHSLGGKTGIDTASIKKQIYESIEQFGHNLTTSIPNTIVIAGQSIFDGIVSLALGLMIGFYMLFDFDKLNNHILNILPKRWKKPYKELTERLNDSLRDYIQGLLLIMLIVFITQAIGLTLAGLKAPLIFALFCALTDIIPYFGPYIGAIPAVIVGFSVSPVTGICTLIAILAVQVLENNFYQPLIMGHTMKLHPVTIMLGLLIFGHFFGIIGLIVATPVIAALKVIFTYLDEKLNIIDKLTGEK